MILESIILTAITFSLYILIGDKLEVEIEE